MVSTRLFLPQSQTASSPNCLLYVNRRTEIFLISPMNTSSLTLIPFGIVLAMPRLCGHSTNMSHLSSHSTSLCWKSPWRTTASAIHPQLCSYYSWRPPRTSLHGILQASLPLTGKSMPLNHGPRCPNYSRWCHRYANWIQGNICEFAEWRCEAYWLVDATVGSFLTCWSGWLYSLVDSADLHFSCIVIFPRKLNIVNFSCNPTWMETVYPHQQPEWIPPFQCFR